jgi:hypothetical protein
MLNAVSEISLSAVLVATVVNFLMGGIWFAGIFAKQYAYALGRENNPKEKPAPIYLLGPLLCGFVTTITNAILMRTLQIDSISSAIIFGAVVGFGYLAATTTNTAINPNIPRPLCYGMLSGSFFVLSNVVVSAILVTVT